MNEKGRKKMIKEKERQKEHIPKYLQWWSLGVGNIVFCFAYMSWFLLVSKYSFIKRERAG